VNVASAKQMLVLIFQELSCPTVGLDEL